MILVITHRMEAALLSNSSNEPAIHKLVDDILEYIFLLNATPQTPSQWPPPIPKEPTVEHATTVASSQVCRRWRTIAFNCHTIWSLIVDYRQHSLKWIETLLNRSNPLPLDFGSRFHSVSLEDDARGKGVLELVFNHIDRLRNFIAHVPASSWELVCLRFLQVPAPNLEIMYIFPDGFAGHLTHPLFDNHAPNLRSIGLRLCTVDFTSPVLTPLTELFVDISQENGLPTLSDWLNILGGMPCLRSVHLNRSISRGSPNDIFPFIHLDALDMLIVHAPLHECVALLKHLILPPRCGWILSCDHAHEGFDQRQLWAIIEKKIGSWPKNSPHRRINAVAGTSFIDIGNIPREDDGRESKDVDPTISISLYLSDFEETLPLFHSLFALFEPTFFDTKWLHLSINHDPARGEAFSGTVLVDNFRGFVNLEKLIVGNNDSFRLLFPLLNHTIPVLLPRLNSLHFYSVSFQDGSDQSDSTLRVADFLQWRREQGFPVEQVTMDM